MTTQEQRAKQLALAYSVLGAIACAAIASIGFVAAVFFLEKYFVPPLDPIANFGQFGLLPLAYAPIGFLYGLTLGYVPYAKRFPWIRTATAVALLWFLVDLWLSKAEVLEVAILIVAFSCVFIGILLSIAHRWIAAERR